MAQAQAQQGSAHGLPSIVYDPDAQHSAGPTGNGPAMPARPAADLSAVLFHAADLLQAGDDAAALELVEGAADKSEAAHPELLRTLSGIYRRQGDLDASVSSLERLLNVAPDDVAAWIAQGDVLAALDAHAAAARSFRRALELSPDNAAAIIGLAEAMSADGDGAGARLLLAEHAPTAIPTALRLNWAEAALARGRLETARTEIEYATSNAPEDPATWHLRARVEFAAERYPEALRDIGEALRLDGPQPDLLVERGRIWLALGNTRRADVDFEKALALAPDDVRALVSRGAVHQRLGRHEEALKDFNRAVQLGPDNVEARLYRAASACFLGAHARCLHDADRAIALDPQGWRAHVARGHALLATDRDAAAVESYAKAVARVPTTDANWLLGRLRQHARGQLTVDGDLIVAFLYGLEVDDLLAQVN